MLRVGKSIWRSKHVDKYKKQAGESQVGEAMPAAQPQAASSGQQPSQPSSSTAVEAEIEKATTVAKSSGKQRRTFAAARLLSGSLDDPKSKRMLK